MQDGQPPKREEANRGEQSEGLVKDTMYYISIIIEGH